MVDCKSASGRSFDKFASHNLAEDDPFGYIAQISAYAQANGIDKAAFLAIDKSTGKICLTPVHSMEMINAGDRVKKIKNVQKTENQISRWWLVENHHFDRYLKFAD